MSTRMNRRQAVGMLGALGIGITVHSHRLDAEFAQATYDTHRDLAAIGNEHALEGGLVYHLGERR